MRKSLRRAGVVTVAVLAGGGAFLANKHVDAEKVPKLTTDLQLLAQCETNPTLRHEKDDAVLCGRKVVHYALTSNGEAELDFDRARSEVNNDISENSSLDGGDIWLSAVATIGGAAVTALVLYPGARRYFVEHNMSMTVR